MTSLGNTVRRSSGLRYSTYYTAKVGFDYQTLINDIGWGMQLSNNYAYSSKQYANTVDNANTANTANTANNPAGISKTRVLVDAGVTLKPPGKRYALSLSCSNCTNKIYVGNSLDFGGVRGGGLPVSIVFPGDSRMYQASIRANF